MTGNEAELTSLASKNRSAYCVFLGPMCKFCQVFISSSVILFKVASLVSPKCCHVKLTDVCYGSRNITLHYTTSCSLQNRCQIRRRRRSLIMCSIGCWNLFLNVSQKKETIDYVRLELVKLMSAWLVHCSVPFALALFQNYQVVRKPEALTAWLAVNFPFRKAICEN
jgi:hypothetical protein